jgi:hypothetical protein
MSGGDLLRQVHHRRQHQGQQQEQEQAGQLAAAAAAAAAANGSMGGKGRPVQRRHTTETITDDEQVRVHAPHLLSGVMWRLHGLPAGKGVGHWHAAW